MARVDLKNVRKSYGTVPVIHGVDLTIEDGEFVVFVGPSGCGKSTLLRMIAGLEEINGGDILIEGERMNAVPPAKRGIAMVFQSYALYPHMSVRKNLSFGLETARAPKAEIEAKVAKAAEILRIEHLLDRKPKQLSGGQRQRVAIGRAIVREPRLFLFDEPLSNLDAELRVQMRVEIAKLHSDLGTSMVYVTHDQVEAMTLADKIVVLHGGVIEQVGSPLDLYNNPANIFVAGFIGSPRMNFFKGKAVAGKTLALEMAGTVIPVPLTPPAGLTDVVLGVRPEHISIGGTDGVLLGRATIDIVEQLGGQTIAYGRFADGQNVTIVCEGQKQIAHKQEVELRALPTLLHAFDGTEKRITA
ncbi:MAG: sn-glycerol-3-phosphate ABC transporter ATP-binding protein UgpC [Proteobacteria bacterium]|nr:sn-glycerol-3-phosphate ABC transporter ATP-binding protein UgpC [Pseudomonadota bacterium]